MTLEELERQAADVEVLNAVQVAGVLGCDPQWLRDQAREGTFPLPFPYYFTGKKKAALNVPKRLFLRYMRGEDVNRLHELIGELIDAMQTRPEALVGWRYTVSGPMQYAGKEKERMPEPPDKAEPPDPSAGIGRGLAPGVCAGSGTYPAPSLRGSQASHPAAAEHAASAAHTAPGAHPARVKPAPMDWSRAKKPAPIDWGRAKKSASPGRGFEARPGEDDLHAEG